MSIKLISGTFLILTAFLLQNIFLADYIEKNNLFHFREQHYSRAHISSITYLNLYYQTILLKGVEDSLILKKAASENYAGFSTHIAEADTTEKFRLDLMVSLGNLAFSVKDMDSYNNYINEINKYDLLISSLVDRKYANVQSNMTRLTWLFVVLYIVGSFLIFWSEIQKNKK